jgi:hypothetical protein
LHYFCREFAQEEITSKTACHFWARTAFKAAADAPTAVCA